MASVAQRVVELVLMQSGEGEGEELIPDERASDSKVLPPPDSDCRDSDVARRETAVARGGY